MYLLLLLSGRNTRKSIIVIIPITLLHPLISRDVDRLVGRRRELGRDRRALRLLLSLSEAAVEDTGFSVVVSADRRKARDTGRGDHTCHGSRRDLDSKGGSGGSARRHTGGIGCVQRRHDPFPYRGFRALLLCFLAEQPREYLADRQHRAVEAASPDAFVALPRVSDMTARVEQAGLDGRLAAIHQFSDFFDLHLMEVEQGHRLALFGG